MEETNDCNICFMPDKPMTEPSNVCLHWNKICKECKKTLYNLSKHDCPYCKKSWKNEYKNEFYIDTIIETFKIGISPIYYCFTDEEATIECKKAMKERLDEIDYALINKYFKEGCHIPENIYERFTTIMGSEASPIIEQLITSTDDLTEEFIELKGRGYLLSEDDLEIEITIYNKKMFLYCKDD